METLHQLVTHAYDQVEKLYSYYQIQPMDWRIFPVESPRIMARIEEIESYLHPSMTPHQVADLLERWVKNWEVAFKRRFAKRANVLKAG